MVISIKAGVLPEAFFHSKLAQFQGHDVTRLPPIAKAGESKHLILIPVSGMDYRFEKHATNYPVAMMVVFNANSSRSCQACIG